MPTYQQEVESLPKRCRAGARFLDKKFPGWWRKVKIRLLVPFSAKGHVLGQLLKTNWWDATLKLELDIHAIDQLGFDCLNLLESECVEFWKKLIRERRKKDRRKSGN